MDYYEILGLSRDAGPDEIKKAYRRLASKHHPDKGGSTQKFQEIQVAYDTLSNPEKRALYDNPQPQAGPNGFRFSFDGNNPNLDEIFRQFGFGPDPFSPFRQQQVRRNKDIRIEFPIELKETLEEQNKTINIKLQNGNNQTVDITIPRGVTSGVIIKYPGLGDNMFNNLPRGDLLVHVLVREDPRFYPAGLDLVTDLTLDSFQAMLGCKQIVTGLDGKLFNVQIPEGCQFGTKLKINGEGLYAFQQDVKGNLYVRTIIQTPTNLSEDQKLLLKSIQDSLK